MKQIVLLGENQAGHERKVKFMDFAGEIEIHAERVHLQAESWMEKQMAQGAGFLTLERGLNQGCAFFSFR